MVKISPSEQTKNKTNQKTEKNKINVVGLTAHITGLNENVYSRRVPAIAMQLIG